MSGKTPLELAKQFNEAGHRGDIEAALSLIAEDVVVTDLGAPLDAPRVHRGRHELLSYYARFAQDFDDFDREVEEWVEAGDWVIAVGRWVGTGKGSGARVESRTASANRFRNGKVVEAFSAFQARKPHSKRSGCGSRRCRRRPRTLTVRSRLIARSPPVAFAGTSSEARFA